MSNLIKTSAFIFILCISISFAFGSNKKNIKNSQPDSVDVIHYAINLNITDFANKTISGNTVVTIASKVNNLNKIKLYLLRLTIDSILQNGNIISNYSYNDTVINIPCSTILSAGDTTLITVYYHGQPTIDPTYWGGFYFVSGYAFNLGVAMKDYPHGYGRVWFPCIEDFIDRAYYDCYITVQAAHKAICGGTLISVTDNGNNTSTYHWNLRDNIPTYLVSVSVGPYIAVRDTFNGMNGTIPIDIYVYPNDSTKAVATFIHLKTILHAFESKFGPYKWERVGYVGVPFVGGAMEHATNIALSGSGIDGTLYYEGTIAHELAHHWFGDLTTCTTDKDMWINEGGATFCEYIYMDSVYGNIACKNYIRNMHNENLRMLHIRDSGYRAIYGTPPDYTYCSTVYTKGAEVIQTLRNYLGDSLFFPAIKSYLSTYSFDNGSTVDIQNHLSNYTGVDLTDFFNFWVYSPGFTHFSVDSFKVVNAAPNYNVTVYVRQKHKGTTNYANSNKIELTFMDSAWTQHTEIMSFSGQYGSQTFSIPIKPVLTMVDINEKTGDATTDISQTIKSAAINLFSNILYFKINVSSLSDSTYLRVTHNWVAPDSFKIENPTLTLANNRYWKLEGILPDTFKARAYFKYDKSTSTYGNGSSYLDNDFITTSADSLVLMYRKDASYDWRKIQFIKSGGVTNGYLYTDSTKLGEYCFARKDYGKAIIINGTGQVVCPDDSLRLYTYKIPGYSYQWLKNDTIISGATDTSYYAKTTALYSVIITRYSYSDTSAHTFVNFTYPQKPTITQNKDTLTSSSATGNQWYFNGNPISGETNQTLVISQTGIYQLIVMVNNCPSIITDTSTFFYSGINNNLLVKNFFDVYPNPNNGTFTIKIFSPINLKYEYQIQNLLGMELYNNSFSGKDIILENIDIRNLANGIYLVNVQTDYGIKYRKLIFVITD